MRRKLFQYSRRRKRKPEFSTGVDGGLEVVKDDQPREDSVATCQHLDEHGGNKSKINAKSKFSGLFSRLPQLEIQTASAVGVVHNDQGKFLEDPDLDGEACRLAPCASSQKQCQIKAYRELARITTFLILLIRVQDAMSLQLIKDLWRIPVLSVRFAIQFLKDSVRNLLPGMIVIDLSNSASSHSAQPFAGRFDPGLEHIAVEKFRMNEGFCSHRTSDDEVQQEIEATSRENN